MSIDPRKAYREYEAEILSAYTADETVAISGHIKDYIDGAIEANPDLDITAAEHYLDQSHGDKTQAARLILGFYDFCERKYQMCIQSPLRDQMPVDVPILRQIEIVKYLHERHTTQEIAKRFCVSDEIIRKDLRALREGIEIMGAKLQIEEEQEGQKRVKYYSSTAHPILLILNLTEISELVRLLSQAAADDDGDIYQSIMARISSQLTPYARERITGNRNGEPVVENNLRNERKMVSSHISHAIAYADKAGRCGKTCNIRFVDSDGILHTLEGAIIEQIGKTIRVMHEGKCYDVHRNQIKAVDIDYC